MEYKPLAAPYAGGQPCALCPFLYEEAGECDDLFKKEFGCSCGENAVQFVAQTERTKIKQ